MSPSPKQLKKHLEFRGHMLSLLSELYLAVEAANRQRAKEKPNEPPIPYTLESMLRYMTKESERKNAAAVGRSRAERRRLGPAKSEPNQPSQ